MAIRTYLKVGAPIDVPTGAEVEPTRFPAGAGCEGRAAIEVVDKEGNVVACFHTEVVAGYVVDPPDGGQRP